MSDLWGDFGFGAMEKEKARDKQEYDRLSAGVIGRRPPVVGERVLVCAGLVFCGALWERHEGVVLEVSENAALVRYTDQMFKKEHVRWVTFPVITDLLGIPPESQ